MRINLQIEKLILEGFDYHDHRRIADSMKIELARLIAEEGLGRIERRAGSDRISMPSFRVPSDKNPRMIGKEIARSVYRGLKS